jgi:primary-amine oxidase
VLWKHFDLPSGVNQSRRARELVIFFFATIGNYDYSIAWVFRQDGSLACEVALTGILLAQGVAGSPMDLANAHVVAPGIASPHHQHFFNFRLDFDVDGMRNDALEMNTFAMPVGDGNRQGNAFTMVETPIPSERLAQRDLDASTARKWRFVNPTKGTGFLLVPGENSVPYASPDSAVRRRARFLDHHLWVTRYREGERHAAGVYPSQRLDADNLLAWSSDDESLAGEDLVVWYTFGVTHTPRPEEWPIMNAHRTGFKLLPAGFFTENPALDVP